jgi:hypothetical protein
MVYDPNNTNVIRHDINVIERTSSNMPSTIITPANSLTSTYHSSNRVITNSTYSTRIPSTAYTAASTTHNTTYTTQYQNSDTRSEHYNNQFIK